MLSLITIIFSSLILLYGLLLVIWPQKFQQFMVKNFAQANMTLFAEMVNKPRYLWFLRVGGLFAIFFAASLLYGILYHR